MNPFVFAGRDKLKVFYPIVAWISVAVVDEKSHGNRAVLFSPDSTMLQFNLTGIAQANVPLFGEVADSDLSVSWHGLL